MIDKGMAIVTKTNGTRIYAYAEVLSNTIDKHGNRNITVRFPPNSDRAEVVVSAISVEFVA